MALELSLLKEFLSYDEATGQFIWLKRRSTMSAGDIAGTPNDSGYIQIRFFGKFYRAHRLAWFYVNGKWPEFEIDHINGIRTDNRICNLRDADRSENAQNARAARSNSKTKLLGASPYRGRFQAAIKLNKKQYIIGKFDTAIEAHLAYVKAKRDMHPRGML